MKLSFPHSLAIAALGLASCLPLAAQAHRTWLLPSSTVVSGNEPWVTVDAAVSNEVFFFDFVPLRLDGLRVTAPDGQSVQAVNLHTGKYRSSFDLPLQQPGTYKITLLNDGVFATYKLKGEAKRWRGQAAGLAAAIPAGAEELKINQLVGRVETFATAGKPSATALKPVGNGLEMVPLTHPADLVAGEPGRFQLLLDEQPAANLNVTVVAGGIRYRDKLDESKLTTDAEGKFTVKWKGPGMYWLQAGTADGKVSIAGATQRRATYAATLEVLP